MTPARPAAGRRLRLLLGTAALGACPSSGELPSTPCWSHASFEDALVAASLADYVEGEDPRWSELRVEFDIVDPLPGTAPDFTQVSAVAGRIDLVEPWPTRSGGGFNPERGVRIRVGADAGADEVLVSAAVLCGPPGEERTWEAEPTWTLTAGDGATPWLLSGPGAPQG